LKLESQNHAMTNQQYLREAHRLFLQGSSFKTPAEAVEAGIKSVVDWCECLNQTRRKYGLGDWSSGTRQSQSRDVHFVNA
jgi:hypothetical protein